MTFWQFVLNIGVPGLAAAVITSVYYNARDENRYQSASATAARVGLVIFAVLTLTAFFVTRP